MQDQTRNAQPADAVDRARTLRGYWSNLTPKLVIALREGYGVARLSRDLLAGLSVAVLALPLSMAIAIAAGASPAPGLVTSVVAGFLISALGGSRYQIGGPAAAFIVIIANILHEHGEPGLQTATFLAGFMLVAAALLKFGNYIKYIPGPVILGFTSGIGIIIAIGQLKDFMGLQGQLGGGVVEKVVGLWNLRDTVQPAAVFVGTITVLVIWLMRRWRPTWPGLLVGVTVASGLSWLLHLPVDTIGSRFGSLPNALPFPRLPDLSPAAVGAVLPSAFTIAFLVGVESLLSAVAADAKTGGRHRSNAEILAQGVANIASPMFAGLPATGVIARTGTNITAGAATPLSGVFHAAFVLGFMVLAAPLAAHLALPCLAGVLIGVAWRLIDFTEVSHFVGRAPPDDRIVLLATLSLTVFADLNTAIAVGFGLACVLFMHRMAQTSSLPRDDHAADFPTAIADDEDDTTPRPALTTMQLPDGIRAMSLRGPLFFGGAAAVSEALQSMAPYPKVLILRMRDVPLVDATAISALETVAADLAKRRSRLVVCGLQHQPRQALHRSGMLRRLKIVVASNGFIALENAKAILVRGSATESNSGTH